MNVLLFGATGMVGQGVLRECLLDPQVQLVQTVGRTATGVRHTKLREIVHSDLWHYATIESDLSGFDACFFCLGVSSSEMQEEEYERLTYGITLAAADHQIPSQWSLVDQAEINLSGRLIATPVCDGH